MRKLRCAIYTRKSSEEGLEQDFNSLDAQREACAAYIQSQKHEGWVVLPQYYDDGGISGGTMERPALQQLLVDVDEGLVDQIVVYKIDRLTRSLPDFAKLVDRLDAAEASFVSVTQSFNTSTSMGRLTLNVLLSFAQFEREVTAERIRDKIAASKKKGMWMGGTVPIGYEANGRTLTINEDDAATVRKLFELFEAHGSLNLVREEAEKLGLKSKYRPEQTCSKRQGNNHFDRGHINHILTNPIYAGKVRHKRDVYDGMHEAIIDLERWERVQVTLQDNASVKRNTRYASNNTSPLCGKLFDENGVRFKPTHTKKRERRYRYYISRHLATNNKTDHQRSNWRLPAKDLENKLTALVLDHLKKTGAGLLHPDASSETIRQLDQELKSLEPSGDILACIERVDIRQGELQVTLNPANIGSLLKIEEDAFVEDALTLTSPFQHRKRGVETKLILNETSDAKDEKLINNQKRAHAIVKQIKLGKSIDQIAEAIGLPKQRVSELSKLAFLSPQITTTILKGEQPVVITSDYLLRRSIPMNWKEQETLFAELS